MAFNKNNNNKHPNDQKSDDDVEGIENHEELMVFAM